MTDPYGYQSNAPNTSVVPESAEVNREQVLQGYNTRAIRDREQQMVCTFFRS
jgi:hypothetical protein